MRKWTWMAILGVAILSLGTAWAESRACTPHCDPTTCVPSACDR